MERGPVGPPHRAAPGCAPAGAGPDPAALLAAIVESSDDAIVSKNLDGVITSWNRGAERMFGYSAPEAIGLPIADLIIPPGMEDEEQHILRRIAAGERVDHFETVRRRRDGSRVEVSVTISPVRNAAGRVVGASKVARDIGDRKRAEAARREVEEMRARLVNMAAHELKTPLTPLKLQVVLLRGWEESLTPHQRAALDVFERNLDRLDHLVDDVLDAVRLQTDHLVLDIAPLDLNEVVADAVETFEEAGRQSGVHVAVAYGPPLPVFGDPLRLLQVVFNLLSNALKATPAGGSIRIETSRTGDEARVQVRDTGAGLAEPDFPTLFHPFSQVQQARVEDARTGTGLGLYISQRIVAGHNGRIWAESPGRGRGATFTFALPMAGEASGRAPPAATPRRAVAGNLPARIRGALE